MSSRGEIHKQLSQILTATKAQGCKFEDVVPPEILAHFQEIKELTSARKYIAESDIRIANLEVSLNETRQTLHEKQVELDNLPSDVLALKIDLQQAHRSVEYYRELGDLAQTRAERSQARLIEAETKLLNREDEAQHIARLEEALQYQTLLVNRLSKESADLEAHYKKLTTSHQDLIACKDKEIEQLRKDNATNSQIMDVHDSLIDAIENASKESADTLNTQSVCLQQNDLFSASLISVVQPLVYYYADTSHVVSLYRAIFHALADPNQPIVTELPPALGDLLDAVNDKLRDYGEMVSSLEHFLHSSDPARQRLCEQVDNMARSAGLMHTYLEDIKVDITGFLARLKNEPDTGLAFKGQDRFSSLKRLSIFGSPKTGAKRPKSIEQSISEVHGGFRSGTDSRRSSISTLALGG